MTEKLQMTSRERARDIARLAGDGLSSREIANKIGISRQRVCFIADRHSIPLARPGSRRFSLYVSDRRARWIRALAEEAKVSPAVMAERLIRIPLDDGLDLARKRLGKLVLCMEKRRS